MKRYAIWWTELPKLRDDAYGALKKFVAAETTTTIRNNPIEVPLG